jgi:hypothetical protein
MKKLMVCACAAVLSMAAVSPCFAADSPWSGTWKENVEKSKLTGATVTITAKGAGYHFSNGPTQYDFACDGKSYLMQGTETLTCKATTDGGFDFVMSYSGTEAIKQRRSFSPDGKLMTMTSTSKAPDGTSSTTVLVRERKSGTTGMVGEWVNAKDTESGTVPQHKTTVTGDMIHIDYPHLQQVVDAKLDGSDGKVTGSRIPPGASVTFKAMGANTLLYTQKLNGKVMSEATWTLSPDGKSYTAVSWLTGKEGEKTTVVFDKQ